jgi:hypothetical protein
MAPARVLLERNSFQNFISYTCLKLVVILKNTKILFNAPKHYATLIIPFADEYEGT